MQVIDLFTGVGGFALAAQEIGWEIICFCEIDKYCQEILKKNFPETKIFKDVRKLTKQKIETDTEWDAGKPTIIVGGFPCQPFSVAGKRQGSADDRYLWNEMFRVIAEVKPDWLLLENVVGIVGMALGQVLSDLESVGYDFPRDHAGTPIVPVIPAASVNAPHKRERVFIIANFDNSRRVGNRLQQSFARHKWTVLERFGNDKTFGEPEKCYLLNASDADKFNGDLGRFNASSVCRDEQTGLFGVQRWEHHWLEAASALCRVDDGISGRLDKDERKAIAALGNAVVPHVIYNILNAIQEAENG